MPTTNKTPAAKLAQLFAASRSAALSLDELTRAGFTAARVRSLVERRELSRGTFGYYLPTPPDAGAMLVMRAAMSSTNDEQESEAA